MLYTNTVTESTLELLRKLTKESVLDEFYLAGGTALALQIGHRISVDLDFFCPKSFDEQIITDLISNSYKGLIVAKATNSISGVIGKTKVEFISHQYPLQNDLIEIEGISLASKADICAMKINACRNRGSKKDFIDLYFLLTEFSIKDMLNAANQKYPNHIDLLTLKSLLYFDDADKEPNCEMIDKISWENVKLSIQEKILPLI